MAAITLFVENDAQAQYPLENAQIKVGRSADCDIVIDKSMGVSRHHCSLVPHDRGWVVRDEQSNNGTFVNGKQIEGDYFLKDGDKIIFGKQSLLYEATAEAKKVVAQLNESSAAAGGAEMTMFVDPNAIKKAQAAGGRRVLAIQQGGGREANCNLIKEETVIGADPSSDIPVKGFLVKPMQAKVIKAGAGNDRIVSMGGWRSVKVNGAKVKEHKLSPGDVITVGKATIVYKEL